MAVQIHFEQKDLQPIVLQSVPANQTLLEVFLQNDIDVHHNCGGVCACTTCHVYVTEGMDQLSEITDKEEDYIDRAIRPTMDSRLSCQAMILSSAANISVTVPDQTQFLGE